MDELNSAETTVTEDKIIIAHTEAWFVETPWNPSRFATERLIQRLERAGLIRCEELKDGDDYRRWESRSCKHVARVLTGESAFPITWKWVWLNAMDEPYRTAALQELQALAGSLYLPLPGTGKERAPTPTALPELMQEISEAIGASHPAQDGMLDSRDCPVESRAYADQLLDVVEKSLQELNNIATGTGVISRRELLDLLNRQSKTIR